MEKLRVSSTDMMIWWREINCKGAKTRRNLGVPEGREIRGFCEKWKGNGRIEVMR